MKNKAIFFTGLFAAAFIILLCGTSVCDDSSQNVRVFRGQVTEVDWVGSLLTVDGGDEMTFYVPQGTKIRYGSDFASLADLEQSDDVLVKYIDNPAGTPKAVSITLNRAYPDF